MLDPSRSSDPDGEPYRTPRWVKVFGIIALVLLLLGVLLLILAPGGHGPGRHLRSGSSGDAGDQTPLSSVTPIQGPPGSGLPGCEGRGGRHG